MLKFAVLFLFVARAFADVPCCKEKERSASYLDIAIDVISKAKDSIPGCNENKECPEVKATDCSDWYDRGYNKSGLYNISPLSRLTSNKSFDVFCDMDTDGGGWTVIQRRGNFGRPNDYFYKNWASYKEGFGHIAKDFWLGNDKMFALTNQKPCSIRFDLQANNLDKAYAVYADFWIDDEFNRYMIHIANYSGNAGDNMAPHSERDFSTKDRNTLRGLKCAEEYKTAWWFNFCQHGHLNGLYNATEKGINWDGFRNAHRPSLIWTEMKIRPKSFASKMFL